MEAIASLGILSRRRAWAAAGWAAAVLCCGPGLGVARDAAPAQAAAGASNQIETVRFSDPRWPAVRVVRGAQTGAPPAALRPPLAAAPVATVRPTGTTSELVSFGDEHGPRVQVLRGTSVMPASATVAAALPGRIQVVRFDDRGLPPVSVVRGDSPRDGIELFDAAKGGELDRVAFAVDGAESGHGRNLAMWRPEIDGPQGPMQVSAAAALDVGGGNRFDMRQNRLMGRAYLALLYQRYGNWPDAIAAYNWGPGNLDLWIAAGRPVDQLPLETARYLLKVLRDALLIGPS